MTVEAGVKIKRAVGYISVSTAEQKEEGYSLLGQRKNIELFAEKQGYEVIDVYADEGISGKNIIKRPGVQSMLEDAKSGKFDVLMDAIVINDERQKVMAFSTPYAQTPASFVALQADLLPGKTGTDAAITLGTDPKEIRAGVEDLRKALKGKTIGIASGTIYTSFIDQNFKDVATIREYGSSSEAILDLQSGRIDVAFDDVTFFNSLMDKPENKSLVYTGPVIKGPIWGEGEALGFRQNDVELKAKFDAALKEAMADGTIKTLSEKWFKQDLTPKQ